MSQSRPIKFINYFCYGLADIIGSGAFTLVSAWLLFFLTMFCGLTPFEAGSIFAVARVVDVIMCPVFGYISDNFNKTWIGKKFGRRRFFILISIPLVSVYGFLWVDGMNYWYYLLIYILFEIVYTMIIIPYDTLAAEMTSNFKERAKLTSARMYIAQLAGFAAAFLPGRLVVFFGKDSPLTFLYTGIIFTATFSIVLIFVYFGTWERSEKDQSKIINKDILENNLNYSQKIKKISYDFLSTLKIKAFRAHLGMYLGGSVAQDIFNAVFTYFIIFALFKTSIIASNLLGVINALQFFGVALATYLTLKNSPSKAFRIQAMMAIIAFCVFASVYFMNINSNILLYIGAIIAGLARGGIYAIPWNNYTFVADVDEILTRERREGLFAGFMSLLRKASQAISIFIVGIILQYTGFISGSETQPQSTINSIIIIMLIIPIILTIWGIISSYKFNITEKTHTILNNEIKRLKEGGKLNEVKNDVKLTIESLTGMPYEKSWGNNTVGYSNKLIQTKK